MERLFKSALAMFQVTAGRFVFWYSLDCWIFRVYDDDGLKPRNSIRCSIVYLMVFLLIRNVLFAGRVPGDFWTQMMNKVVKLFWSELVCGHGKEIENVAHGTIVS
jgi:hypothetical protein